MAYTVKAVEPAQNETLSEIEKKTGPSNFYRTMAHHPSALRDFARLYGTLMGPGSLDRRTKEIVYLATSYVNECDYCLSHHLKTGREAGLTENEIREIQTEQYQNFTPKERAALHYARELTRTCDVENDTRDQIQEQFSNDQVVELTLVIALANFTNRFNNGLSVEVEK